MIGGGVIGVCCAYYLAEQGRTPVIVERDQVCSLGGGTYGNAGLIVPSDVAPLAGPGVLGRGMRWMLDPTSPFWIMPRASASLMDWLWRFRAACSEQRTRAAMPALRALSLASSRLFSELSAGDGSDLTFKRNGLLAVYESVAAYAAACSDQRDAEAFGVGAEYLDGDAVRARFPGLQAVSSGGILTPEDGHAIPHRFVRNLASRAEMRGAQVRNETEVLSLEVSGCAISRVVTTRGSIRPRWVVLAAGAWSPQLAAGLGLDLPIQPAKGYSVSVPRPAGFPEVPLYLGERSVCVTPMDETIRLAGTLELSGYDLRIRQRRVRGIVDAAAAVVGPAAREEPRLVWRGLRPLSADGLPLVGLSPRHDNLVVATGHCMVGLSLGPATGKLVAQLVAGDTPDVDALPFSPGRFGRRA